MAVFFEQL